MTFPQWILQLGGTGAAANAAHACESRRAELARLEQRLSSIEPPALIPATARPVAA
jgi:hypothetical protein